MTKKERQEVNCIKYAMYTILYMNDTICNNIRFLDHDIKKQDKQSKKIYRALENRAYDYFYQIRKIIGNENMWFFSEYCSYMDEFIDDLINEYTEAIEKYYAENNIDNSKYFSKVETVRSLSDLSIIAGTRLVEKTCEISEKTKKLEKYLLKEVNNILQDFATWSYRKVEKQLNLNQNDLIIEKLNKVYTELINYSNFEKSYLEAEKYEKERRKLNINVY